MCSRGKEVKYLTSFPILQSAELVACFHSLYMHSERRAFYRWIQKNSSNLRNYFWRHTV